MSELSTSELIGILCTAYFGSVIASLAGIGGGGILIPLYVIITGLPIKDAVVLTMFTIAGNSLFRALYFFIQRKDNRFIPNYQILRIIILFDGNVAYLGFLLNRYLPNIAIFIMIVIIMLILIYKTFILFKKYLKDHENNDYKNELFIIIDNIEQKLDIPLTEISNFFTEEKYGEDYWYLVENIIYIISSVALVAVFSVFRGLIDPEWLIYLTQFIIVLCFGFMVIRHIRTEYNLRKNTNFNFMESDINWNDPISFIKYCLSASFVGIISTMLGIGGSIIMNPIMLSFKLEPEVVVATSSIGTFFSSIISLIQFIIGGSKFEWYYAFLFGFGFLASFTSIFVLRYFKKYLRIIVVGILLFSLGASLILIIVFNTLDIVKNGIN